MVLIFCFGAATILGILSAISRHSGQYFLSEISLRFGELCLLGTVLCFLIGFFALGMLKTEAVNPRPSSVIHLVPFNASATENKVYYTMDAGNRTISYLSGNGNPLSVNTISLDDTQIIKGNTDKPYIEKFDCKVTFGSKMLFQTKGDRDVYHLIIPDSNS